jgi:hypothetical protein
MKTKIHLSFLFAIGFLFAVTQVKAQGWTVTGANTYTNPLTNNVGVGTITPWTPLSVVNSVYEWNISTRNTNTTAANRNHILIQRANGTSAVTSGFVLGGITFSGFDGSGYSLGWNGGAEITASTTQTWTASARGTALSFNTTSNGTAAGIERMRIDHNGNVGIGTTTPGVNLDVQAANTFNALVKTKTNSTGNNYSAFTAESNTASVQLLQLMGGSGMSGTLFGVNRANGGQLYTNNAPLVIGTGQAYDLTLGTNSTANITVKNGGNVGIGLTSPPSKLAMLGGLDKTLGFSIYAGGVHTCIFNQNQPGSYAGVIQVYSGGSPSAIGSTGFHLQLQPDGGNVGLGLSSNIMPQEKLHVNGNMATPYVFAMYHYEDTWPANKKLPWLTRGWSGTYYDYLYMSSTGNSNSNAQGAMILSSGKLSFGLGSNTGDQLSTTYMTINGNGNVLINKTTQVNALYKLDVNGSVRANEIVVNTTGADFVFENAYKLMPLAALEQNIKENKHLPGIASACEMQTNGVGISELNTSLLQKVEELTLYIIEQNKRIEALEKK